MKTKSWFKRNKSDKNPQSGADHSLSSSSAPSEYQGESSCPSDAHVPIVNLTEQRLQDWRAVQPLLPANGGGGGGGGGGGNDSNGAGASGGAAGGGPAGGAFDIMAAMPGGNANGTTTAKQRGGSASAAPRNNYTASPNQLILLIERGQWAAASNRAATHEHEARQLVKLRKTTKNGGIIGSSSSSGASSANAGAEGGVAAAGAGAAAGTGAVAGAAGGSGSNKRISNVKCKALHHACQKLRSVHTTIYQTPPASYNVADTVNKILNNNNTRRIIEEDEYIEACKCILTLIRMHPEACKERESRHGCLPLHLCVFSMCATPPPPANPLAASKGGGGRKGRRATDSAGGGGRPPAMASRSVSGPHAPLHPPSSVPQSNAGKGHRSTPSSSSANSGDFSLGNISQMIQEETEHQQALADHRENSKRGLGEEDDAGNNDHRTGTTAATIEEEILKTQKDMERFLDGWENKHHEKKREQRLDRLEERSRETDSQSDPQNSSREGSSGGGSGSGSNTSSSGGGGRDERTGAQVDAMARDSKMPSAAAVPDPAAPPPPSPQPSPPPPMPAPPTYEELQRRYLQINTLRRTEYSVRVLNALLDAWPKSVKTSSEGGRLPLHMACFGKATVKVMETILKAYPDAARQRNHDGFLPIHIAAHWGVSHPDIAPLILRAYPDGAVGRNRWERTPIEEALGMAGENGRDHQLSLVWSLRRHPTYWIHNDIGMMLLPRNVRCAPWRMVDVGDYDGMNSNNGGGSGGGGDGIINHNGNGGGGMPESEAHPGHRRMMSDGSGAVDVDEVGSSDEEDEGFEIAKKAVASLNHNNINHNDPKYIRALASSTDLSLLITKDKHWAAAALRCRLHPHEARDAMEVKVRGAYTAKITPLHYACENRPSAAVVKALIDANPQALERRQEPGGQLPLHAACTWGASPEVIQLLLQHRPQAAEMKDFLSNLPLHCACYSGAETVVIEALLRAYPQGVWPRNHQGSGAVDIVRRLGHGNRREVLGLLERTVGRLLERATAANKSGAPAASLEWV